MNNQIQEFARNTIKDGLAKCTDGQQRLFKCMYANGNLGLSINDIVDQMQEDKLDWAMQQVENTLKKNQA